MVIIRNMDAWKTPEALAILAAWAREGLEEEEIARRCGVRPAALRSWKRRCPSIARALARTREVADAQVEEALLHRALGYMYTETVTEENGGAAKTRKTRKLEPPNVAAQRLWLACRRPDRWGGRPDGREALEKLDGLLGEIGREPAP